MTKKYDIVDLIDSDQFTYQLYKDMAASAEGTADVSVIVLPDDNEELIFEFDLTGFVPAVEDNYVMVSGDFGPDPDGFELVVAGSSNMSLVVGVTSEIFPLESYELSFKITKTETNNKCYLNDVLILTSPLTLTDVTNLEFYRDSFNGDVVNMVFGETIVPSVPLPLFSGTISGYSVPLPPELTNRDGIQEYSIFVHNDILNEEVTLGFSEGQSSVLTGGFTNPTGAISFTDSGTSETGGDIDLDEIYHNDLNGTYTIDYVNIDTYAKILIQKDDMFLLLANYNENIIPANFYGETTNVAGDQDNLGTLTGTFLG